MAIIKCPECNWYISDKSLFCVRCGCCFVDFEGLVKSLFANMAKENKVPEIKEEVKATTIEKPVIKKPKFRKEEVVKTDEFEKKPIAQPEVDNEKVIYSVHELKKVLGIGINQAYDLVHSKQFPILHIGKKIVIPIEPFNKWLQKSGGIK